jgi:hypothetical protein
MWAVLVAAVAGAAEPSLRVEPDRDSVGKYEKVEFHISLASSYSNPYNPEEVNVSLVVTTPDRQTVVVPAFFYQHFEQQRLEGRRGGTCWRYPVGSPDWRARFAPTEIGAYECRVRLVDQSGELESAPIEFQCTPSDQRGFIRVARKDPRFLEFTEGGSFFPIGQNVAFIGPAQYVDIGRLEQIFDKLSRNGANFVRIWTCCEDWAMALEARKSAWGRSWNWQPPLVAEPGRDGYATNRKCAVLRGGGGELVELSPCYPVAVRPDTRYLLTGEVRIDGGASLTPLRNGSPLGQAITLDDQRGPWIPFGREFTAADGQFWLGRLGFRFDKGAAAWLRKLSLQEALGGPELLWEADPNRPLLGCYNQLDCFLLDQVVQAAEQRGIHLQLCLVTRDLYMHALRDPDSDDYRQATWHATNLLRYAVARWGYSTHVAAWEYFNEMDPGRPTDPFYDALGRVLEQIDPYDHLRTTSAWGPAPKDWRHGRLDMAQLHWYLRPAWKEIWKDEVAAVCERAGFLLERTEGRPAMLAEFGLADDRWGLSPYMKQDRDLTHFRRALWASSLSGLSGTAMFWWWEQIDQQDGYSHYRPLSLFLADVPFAAGGLRQATATVANAPVRVIGLQTDDSAHLWLADERSTWWRTVVDRASPEQIGGATLRVEGLQTGDYRVQWWDTRRGQVIRETAASLARGPLRLEMPRFVDDIACKIQPAD